MWEKLPFNLTLGLNEVHIWLLDLNLAINKIDELKNLLADDELIRANKFHFEKHQHRFIIARANLRVILSKYLLIMPQEIKFNYTQKGKPFLLENINTQKIEFNLSHSENFALYGFTTNRKIGIDIEKLKDNCDVQNLAKRFFTNSEYQIINNLKGVAQKQAFFRAWTSKEAYLKATGEGLVGGLDTIETELNNLEQKLISIKRNQQLIENWQLQKIDINDDYIATIAIESLKEELKFCYFTNINFI